MCFLIIIEVRSPRSRCQQGWFLLRPLWLGHGRLLPVSSHGHPSECVCILISSSGKDTGHTGLGFTSYTTSFYLNYLFKGLISKQSHSEVLEIRTSTQHFWQTHFSPYQEFK